MNTKLISEFADSPEEVHSLAYGFSAGVIGGFTWGGEHQTIGITAISALLGGALGIKRLELMKNGTVISELGKEPQYAVFALAIGFLIGLGAQTVIKSGVLG